MEIVVPDVDAMIDEITAEVTDPDRNPNVGEASRSDNGRDRNQDDPVGNGRERNDDERVRDEGDRDQDNNDRDRDDNDRDASGADNRARSVRERINDRLGRDANNGSNRDNGSPNVVPGGPGNDRDRDDDCFPFC